MNDKLKQTMRILRRPKVITDDRGHTVWNETVETANLELVSTQRLKQIIESDDHEATDQLRDVAEGTDGLLAHDADKGRFEIISDEELQHILNGTDVAPESSTSVASTDEPVIECADEGEELELVSTQLLRKILSPDDEEQDASKGSSESGFDPYDRG